jgi:hypothetical protein
MAGLIGRSRIILERPNFQPSEAMPLGNGMLGIAAWSAGGFHAQLNRIDTMPHRLSPGQLVVPSLEALIDSKDYRGWLDLYRGEFVETGAGMKLVTYVQPDADLLELDVSGADPKRVQSADLLLWPPRAPKASVHRNVGLLTESWIDNQDPGRSGKRFGSIAAITAEGRNVHVTIVDRRTVRVSWMPNPDGSFRILVAAPGWRANTQPIESASRALASRGISRHVAWWQSFWRRAGAIRVDSADGIGEYMENLRVLYLYAAACERGTAMPGSQAGIADLFSSVRDAHRWDPAAFWHLNLRMQVAANLKAGLPELNESYFALYRNNVQFLTTWTRAHMRGRPGVCVPETMRFNGVGIEYETGGDYPGMVSQDCDADSPPFYNARTISTGAEVSYWIWQQYESTSDIAFLRQNYPLMRAAAQFLTAYEHAGSDGLTHTSPSNAHETQWDVADPATDLSARRTLYRETEEAARILNIDSAFAEQLHEALAKVPSFPRISTDDPKQLLQGSSGEGHDIIAESAEPAAPQHNVENIGLEPIWPYGLIGDDGPMTPLGRRTFEHRPYPTNQDWSFDPVQAARLGLDSEVSKTLRKLTELYQAYPNGFSNWGGGSGEFYIEQSGIVALTLEEILVQDYDGILRIAPAVPPGWTMAGTVAVQGRSQLYVETREKEVVTCVLEAGTSRAIVLRSPWPGEAVSIVDDATGHAILQTSKDRLVHFHVLAKHSYIIRREGHNVAPDRFAPLTGAIASKPKHLGGREIGLD